MIRAIRPNAMAQDDASMIAGWNISPNTAYTLYLAPGASACGVFLFDAEMSMMIASGAALVGTAQPCVLVQNAGTVGMVDADLGWHLLITTNGTESERVIRIGPAVDLPDEIHPIYGEDDLAVVRATAGVNGAAHYIDDLAVTCPLGLGAGIASIVSVPVDGVAVVGQVEGITWAGTPNGATETAVIRRHVAIAPEPHVDPVPITPPDVADDEAETDAANEASGNVLTNDDAGLVIVAVNGLVANVGVAVAGSNGGAFVLEPDGAWTFDPDGDFDSLESGETADTSVTYHASDGTAEAMATLTITVSSSAAVLWTPAEITTAAWFDASDSSTITLESSVVSQWSDKSGNASHATASGSTRPAVSAAALNGLDVLTFDGSDDFMTIGTVLGRPSNYTVFAVSRPTKALSNLQAVISSVDSAGNSRNSCLTLANDGGSTFWNYGNYSNYRWGYAGGGFTVNTFAQHCLLHTNGTQNESVYRNGTLLTNSGLAGTATANSGTAQTTSIGRFGAFNGWYFGGNVAEIVVLISAASVDDRQKVEGYLAHKWGLAANLPSDHPYKSAPPTV